MELNRIIFILAAFLVLNGCAYKRIEFNPADSHPVGLTPGDILCVMVADDGSFNSTTYHGSGRVVSNCVLAAVRTKYPTTKLVEVADEENGLVGCNAKRASFMLSPVIVHWEDRATNYSWMRDHVRIDIRLIKIGTGSVSRTLSFDARNSAFAFGNADPSEMLNSRFERGITRLIGN